MQLRPTISTLILLRHGQSVYNGDPFTGESPRFTGWCDVPLTVKGRVEAVAAGQLLRSRGFRAAKIDVAFTSELQRAHESCELALASMAGAQQGTWSPERIRRDARLNERHYGSVQGYYKNDPELIGRFGDETIRTWRRSLHAKPPPITQDHPEWLPPPAPATESLADCQKRVLECFNERIAPALFDEADGLRQDVSETDRTVVVVAHANTIRSLMAALDNVPDADIPNLHVPNSVPILYRFERSTSSLLSTRLQSAAGGSHARWLLSPENHEQIKDALKPGGMLTRALLDSWDVDGDRVLSVAEIEAGIQSMLVDGGEAEQRSLSNCATMAVAKKIVRELPIGATVTLEEFETLAAAKVAGIEESAFRLNARDELGAPGSEDHFSEVLEWIE